MFVAFLLFLKFQHTKMLISVAPIPCSYFVSYIIWLIYIEKQIKKSAQSILNALASSSLKRFLKLRTLTWGRLVVWTVQDICTEVSYIGKRWCFIPIYLVPPITRGMLSSHGFESWLWFILLECDAMCKFNTLTK